MPPQISDADFAKAFQTQQKAISDDEFKRAFLSQSGRAPTPPPLQQGTLNPPGLSDFSPSSTPLGVAGTQLRNVGIGALEPFSARDVEGNFKVPDVISGAFNLIPQAFQAGKEMLTGGGTAKGQELIKGLVEAPLEPVRKLASGDWQKAAEGAGGFLTTTVPAIEGAVKSVTPSIREALKPKGFQEPPVPKHVQNIVDAVGKDNKVHVEDAFRKVVDDAFPDLKAAEAEALGRGVKNSRDAIRVARFAKEKAWAPYQYLLDQTKTPLLRKEIIERAVANLPDEIKNTQAASYKEIIGEYARDLAKEKYTANEIEQAAQALNVELKAYYTKNNLDRAAASKLPETAGKEAKLRAYRDYLDETIKADTGQDAAHVRTKYGQIKAIENSMLERPSGDDTLFEVLTRSSLGSTTPRGIAGKIALHAIKQSPDQLIARAFKQYKLPEQTSLVHVPKPPIAPPTPSTTINVTGTVQQPGRSGFRMRAPVKGQLGPGQKLLPGPGETDIKITPQPPESFAEALAREQTPQSGRMRQTVKKGPYNKQSRPLTAAEWVKTQSGTEMPNKPKP